MMKTVKGIMKSFWSGLALILPTFTAFAVVEQTVTTVTLDPLNGQCEILQDGASSSCIVKLTYNVVSGPSTPKLYIDGVIMQTLPGYPANVTVSSAPVTYEVGTSQGTLTSAYAAYTARFAHNSSTHNAISGDFNGDGNQDTYYQPLLEGVTGGILPDSSTVFYDFNGYHKEWTTAHHEISEIEDWSAESYSAYASNLTASAGDELLLIGKREIVLIHGKIVTPIVIPKAVSNAIVSWDSNGVATYNSFDLDVDPNDFNVFFADFDGDGDNEIFFQSNSTGGSSYIVAGDGTVTQTLSNGYQGLDWSTGSTIELADLNGDGRVDMRVTDADGNVYMVYATVSGGFTDAPVSMTEAWKMKTSAQVADAPLVSPTVPANELIGAVEGQGGVSGGAGTYSIPIAIAPGRNGVQPAVGLNYSSRSGNGIAGVGWSVSYGSAISRCSSNMAQDGRPASVRFDASTDKICLDGQKLKLVSGTYGENGATYATEIESFSLVTQTGGDINDTTTSFRVEHRDGSVAYYGKSSDSRHVLSGRTETLNWLLTKKHDSVGFDSSAKNVVHYDYLTHGAGEVLIDEIYYTGEGSTRGNRKVKFVYETRTDTSTSYLFGGKQRQTKRLANIETYYANSLIRSYNLAYSYSRASDRSILKSVEECGPNSQCLPLTNFTWQDAPVQYELEELNFTNNGTALSTPPYRGEVKVENVIPYRDINRDGARDWPGYFVNAEGEITGTSGTEEFQCNLDGWVNRHNCREADFNRDGRTDVWEQDNNQVKIGYVNADLSKTWITTNIPVIDANNLFDFDAVRYIQDFNGDGWPDIAMFARRLIAESTASKEIILYMHTGDISNPYPSAGQVIFTYHIDSDNEFNTPQFVGDFDGNGIPDIVVSQTRDTQKQSGAASPYPTQAILFDYDGMTLTSTTHNLNLSEDQTSSEYFSYFIDVNGDGLLDWLGWRSDGGAPDTTYSRLNGELILRINEGDLNFSSVISLGAAADLQAIHYITGAPGSAGDPNPFGPADVHILPLYAGSFRSMDINGDGRNELLIPGNRLIDGCITQLVGPQVQEETVCGEYIYSTYESDPYNGISTAPWPASLDESVYEFDAIYFDENSSGVITARRENSGIVGSANQLSSTDAFGDGLTDIVFTVGATTVSSELKRSESSYTGVPHDGAYINRNKGSASGSARYAPSDMMTGVTNGLGHQSSWAYKPLSSGHQTATGLALYDITDYIDTDTSDLNSVYFHFASSMYVAASYTTDNGIGGDNAIEYAYRSAVYNADGRGFQGFRQVIVDTPSHLDSSGNVDIYSRAVSTFHQKFPKAGAIETVKTCLSNDVNNELCDSSSLSVSSASYFDKVTSNGVSRIVIPTSKTQTSFDLTNRSTQLSTSTTTVATNDIDSFGNVLKSTTTTNNGFSTVTAEASSDLSYNDTDWPWGKLNFTTSKAWTVSGSAVHDSSLDSTKEIKTEYTWTANHQPDVVTTRPMLGGGKVTVVDTDYNAYGLPSSVKTYESGDSTNARSVTTTYSNDGVTVSADGYFTFKVTNDLSQSVYSHTAPEHGQSIKSIDANGLEAQTVYDIFGRVEQITPPTGTGQPAYKRFADCDGGCDSLTNTNIRYKVTTYSAGSPESVEYKDKLNRTLVVKTESFDGTSSIYATVQYDALGRKIFESVPSFSSTETLGTEYKSYDAIGRVTEKTIDQPLNQEMTVTYAYNNHQTSIVANGDGQVINMSRTYSGNNQLMQTIQNDGIKDIVTQYAYDAMGNPIVLMDANNHPIEAEYNALGQKLYVNDPNMGYKSFTYTQFGEILEETDANNDTYRYEYDAIGRLYERKLNGTLEASFYFDTAAKGGSSGSCIGLPVGEDREDLSSGQSFGKTYTYDSYCRVTKVTTDIDGTNYEMSSQYDSNYGRIKAVTYPTGLTVKSLFNSRGYLTHSLNAASDYVFHQVTDMDARLQITEAQKAGGVLSESSDYFDASGQMRLVNTTATSGGDQRHRIEYQYDGFGNLSRQDVENQRDLNTILSYETYTYDDLHRLKTSDRTIAGAVQTTINYGYDDVGNLKLKDDFATSYTYGDMNKTNGNAGPNAVRSVALATGGTATFSYDSNGNLTSGNGKTISYNAFNKPVSISKGGITSSFYYGADQMRYKQVKTGKPNGTETTIYIDKAYEEITYNGETQKKVYIGDTIITETEGTSSDSKIGFVHRDRLGSVVTITDENGNVVDNKSYDPFGKPRKGTFELAETSTLAGIAQLDGFVASGDSKDLHTRRGFTDHEHLDDAELIHMNGRVYDYNIGRFLSVDPFIQEPGNSQSMNPYSYILNNPLGGTDPSGYRRRGDSRSICDRGSWDSCNGGDMGGAPPAASDNGKDDESDTDPRVELIAQDIMSVQSSDASGTSLVDSIAKDIESVQNSSTGATEIHKINVSFDSDFGESNSSIRWGQLFDASLGIIGNGLGMIVGGALLGAPEPTTATKWVGAAVMTKSTAGFGLSVHNFTQAIMREDDRYDAPETLLRAGAVMIDPENETLQRFADASDLTLDLMAGRAPTHWLRGLRNPSGDMLQKLIHNKKITDKEFSAWLSPQRLNVHAKFGKNFNFSVGTMQLIDAAEYSLDAFEYYDKNKAE